jgi:hypothetical protein
MHYFFLAVFCWMLCEGILIYLKLVVVFDSGKSYSRRFFALGWGIAVQQSVCLFLVSQPISSITQHPNLFYV